MKPGKPLSLVQSSILTRIPMNEQIVIGGVRNSQALELAQNSNCWLCEGWTEHRFTYEPGVSDANPNHDEFKPIKLHLEIDHFEGDLMMKASETGFEYDLYRMLPPGAHRYFFSIGGEPCTAQDQNRTKKKKEKKSKKLILDMSKLEIPKFEGTSTNISPKKDSRKASPKNFR